MSVPDTRSMEVFAVTTFFPNSVDRQRAVFVENLVRAMRRLCPINVIAPIPFAPPVPWVPDWYAQSHIPGKETIDGVEILHPRFIVVPKLGWLSGLAYFLGVLPVLRRAAKKCGRLVIHAHCAYPDGVGAALAARVLGLPYVITTHGSDINVYAARRGLRAQIRWALCGAAGVIAVSHDLERKIRTLLGTREARVEYIPCAGFNPDVFILREPHTIRRQLPVTASGRLAVFIGNLVPIKGIEVLIEAWARLRRARDVTESDQLIIIGDGKCRAALQRQASDAGIARYVIFVGTVSQPEVSRWLAAADMLCLPSYNEGTPNVVVEALACGVPVVATRVGGVPEVVSDGINGMLVPPGDPERLARAIRNALSQAWDREAISRSVAHLTWDTIAEKNCRFLHSVTHEVADGSLA